MAKRGADDQLTKDDRDDRDDEDDPGLRDKPLKPVEGRVIRGIPKRKAHPAEAPQPVPAAAPESAPKSAFSGFSFGSTSSAAPAPSFSFGATAPSAASSTPASTSSPFSGFSFNASASTSLPTSTGTGEKRPADEASEPAAKKPFSGFSFAAPAAAPASSSSTSAKPSGFSFGAPASSAKPTTAASPFTFGQTSSASAPAAPSSGGAFSFGQTQKSERSAPPTSNGADGSSSVQSASEIPSSSTVTPAAKPASSTPPPEGEVKYYTALRGLNASTLSFLTSTLEKDAFANLADILPGLIEQYKRYLDQEASKAGWRPSAPSTSTSITPAPKKAEETKKAPAAPPAAPSGGFTFGGQQLTASAPSASTGKGFTPSLPASGSSSSPFAFSFGAKSAEPAKPAEVTSVTETPKKTSAAVTKLVEDAISGKSDDDKKTEDAPAAKPFTFNSDTSAATPDKKAGSSLFAFAPSGPLKPATPDSKSFTPSTNVESVSSSTTPAKLGKFGPGGSAPQLAFGGASSSSSTPGGTKSTGFAFGAPSSGESGFSMGSGAPFTSQVKVPESASTPFSFGTSAPAEKASSGFQFGTPASKSTFSFGAPSGSPSFSFGATTSQTGPLKQSQPASFSSAFNSFAAPPYTETDSQKPQPSETTNAAAQPDAAATEAAAGEESQSAEPSVNLAEAVGAGEEDEETLTEMRAKLYKLVDGKFVVVGLGAVKLKKKTENGKRRLLMRTDGAGSVILNMAVTASLSPSAEKAVVKFVGTDLEGQPMVYNLRVKTPEMASEFVEAVKKEVEAIKSA